MFKRRKTYLVTWEDGYGRKHRDLAKAKDMEGAWRKIVKRKWPLTTSLIGMTAYDDEKGLRK